MAILNLCISLIFVFLIFAIVVSGIQEWWAQYRGLRGKWLRLGMQRLINDDALFVRVLQHPLVGNLYPDRATRGRPPSYVEPTSFALALAAVMQRRAALLTTPAPAGQALTFATLREATVQLAAQKSSTADSVLPILDKAGGDLDAALKGIEAWFTSGMDRVTGWYKASAQRGLFVIGFLVAVIGNVDTIAIYAALNHAPTLSAQIADSASKVVADGHLGSVDTAHLQSGDISPEQAQEVLKLALASPVNGLPLGYGCLAAAAKATPQASSLLSTLDLCRADLKQRWDTWTITDWLVHVLGWILTALAGTLGAPYWFAMLSKVVSIRGSGPKPATDHKT
jgi:hypothetical protein